MLTVGLLCHKAMLEREQPVRRELALTGTRRPCTKLPKPQVPTPHYLSFFPAAAAAGVAPCFVSVDGRYAGLIVAQDAPRPEAAEVVEKLESLG